MTVLLFGCTMNLEQFVINLLSETKIKLLDVSLNELPIKPVISLQDKQLTLELTAGFPTQLIRDAITPVLMNELKKAAPELEVQIVFKDVIKAHQTQLPGKALRGVKNVIAIASGKGGVGKSTVAVNLAVSLARSGAQVGILDADIYGPSIPLMLGHSDPVEVKNDRYIPVKAYGVHAMSIGYLTKDDPALIWRGPMLAKSMLQMLDITTWEELDYLFIDLPPGTGDIQLSLVQKIPLAGAVVVTTPQHVATLDAEKAIKMFAKTQVDVLGLIENMSMHVCSKCSHEEALFGSGGAAKISELYHCPLLGQLPLSREIGKDCDKGHPTASHDGDVATPFIKAGLNMAIELAKKPRNYADKIPPVQFMHHPD